MLRHCLCTLGISLSLLCPTTLAWGRSSTPALRGDDSALQDIEMGTFKPRLRRGEAVGIFDKKEDRCRLNGAKVKRGTRWHTGTTYPEANPIGACQPLKHIRTCGKKKIWSEEHPARGPATKCSAGCPTPKLRSGESETQVFYRAPVVAHGKSCQGSKGNRKCDSGTLTDFQPPAGFSVRDCYVGCDPAFLGRESKQLIPVDFKETLTVYRNPEPVPPAPCVSRPVTYHCKGTWANSTDHPRRLKIVAANWAASETGGDGEPVPAHLRCSVGGENSVDDPSGRGTGDNRADESRDAGSRDGSSGGQPTTGSRSTDGSATSPNGSRGTPTSAGLLDSHGWLVKGAAAAVGLFSIAGTIVLCICCCRRGGKRNGTQEYGVAQGMPVNLTRGIVQGVPVGSQFQDCPFQPHQPGPRHPPEMDYEMQPYEGIMPTVPAGPEASPEKGKVPKDPEQMNVGG